METADADIVLLLQKTGGEVSRVVREIESLGYSVATVRSPPTKDSLRSILERFPRATIITPGGVPGDFLEFGGRVVKGTYSLKPLPKVLRIVEPQDLSPVLPAEKLLGGRFVEVVKDVLGEVASGINGFNPPASPPPVFVLSEVYVDGFPSVFDAILEAAYRAAQGADVVVIGASGGDSESFASVFAAAARDLGIEAGVDPPSHDFLEAGLPPGSPKPVVYMSVWEGGEAPNVESRFTTILPRYRSNDTLQMAEDILRSCKWGVREGLNPIVDPVLRRPGALPYPFESLAALKIARERGMECPAMVGINNVYEMIDADTTGSIPVLTLASAESGASAILVSEESTKSRGATAEARIASYMVSYALATGSPPKDLGFGLLESKEKSPGYRPPSGCYALKLLPRRWKDFVV
ncbi:conserved hypothetical protein [Aeropyrum pernix K1]|uniref:Pterin-binding domain-containing protein n=1 Tax=Aeropyrum pernix (strain ATCC 700893 / DSM 11879 / JCM 9820 / NBRC 100138 / K1) TaxID=272557 RepID=Q9YDW6_AERPE|nr:dihydropteroate synthase [Aeropyrum pernix]BAA79781.2 conserved hypothetical protein [Aeropyrum pernix K1]